MHATQLLPSPVVKPLLRGWSHLTAFVAASIGAVMLVLHAQSGLGVGLAAIYGASLCALLGTSALYHCPTWSQRARHIIRPLDHSAIFVLIAGSFTPLYKVLDAGHGRWLLALGWAAALLGIARAVFWEHAPKKLVAAQSVLTGWVVVAFVPALVRALPGATLGLIVLGGALYTVGAAVYAFRRPNPWPRVFGFHEVFHLFVIAAAGAHFAAMWQVLGG